MHARSHMCLKRSMVVEMSATMLVFSIMYNIKPCLSQMGVCLCVFLKQSKAKLVSRFPFPTHLEKKALTL